MITLNNFLNYPIGALTRQMPIFKANSALLRVQFSFVLPVFTVVFSFVFGFSFDFPFFSFVSTSFPFASTTTERAEARTAVVPPTFAFVLGLVLAFALAFVLHAVNLYGLWTLVKKILAVTSRQFPVSTRRLSFRAKGVRGHPNRNITSVFYD